MPHKVHCKLKHSAAKRLSVIVSSCVGCVAFSISPNWRGALIAQLHPYGVDRSTVDNVWTFFYREGNNPPPVKIQHGNHDAWKSVVLHNSLPSAPKAFLNGTQGTIRLATFPVRPKDLKLFNVSDKSLVRIRGCCGLGHRLFREAKSATYAHFNLGVPVLGDWQCRKINQWKVNSTGFHRGNTCLIPRLECMQVFFKDSEALRSVTGNDRLLKWSQNKKPFLFYANEPPATWYVKVRGHTGCSSGRDQICTHYGTIVHIQISCLIC
jgi:hypothetical protein